MHWFFAFLSYKSDVLDHFIKGTHRKIVENVQINREVMRKNHITKEDLFQQVRTNGKTDDLNSFQKDYFERSGDISIIQFKKKPKVLEVEVEKGVETIRIVLE
jgi:uncharacterized membrane protein YcaP (DUF421 family)